MSDIDLADSSGITYPSPTLYSLPEGIEGEVEALTISSLSSLGAKEVQHLQRWIRNCPEMLGEPLVIIACELNAFDKTRDRLDLLAVDENGRLVVIELKRDDSGSSQDLQALRYCAYVSALTSQQVLELLMDYRRRWCDQPDMSLKEAEQVMDQHCGMSMLQEIDQDEQPRVILLAGHYRPGVTATCVWLRRNFNMDIRCLQLAAHQSGNQTLLSVAQLLPLPQAEEFEVRLALKHQNAQSRRAGRMNWKAAQQFVASIPEGQWASYRDVATAAGAPGGSQAVAGWLSRNWTELEAVHRVLSSEGRLVSSWLDLGEGEASSLEQLRAKLEAEGVKFNADGSAAASSRFG